MSEREFVLSASMDMHWFPPRDAQRLLQLGLETKLLESQGGAIRPAFDVSSVEVPRDYIPTSAILEVPTPVSEDIFLRIVDAIAASDSGAAGVCMERHFEEARRALASGSKRMSTQSSHV